MKTVLLFALLLSCTLVVSEVIRYEYIVVGSGSAGSVIAARLAADGRSVLLIERGNDVLAPGPFKQPFTNVNTMNDAVAFFNNGIGVRNPVPLELLPTEHQHTVEDFMIAGSTFTVAPWALGGGPAVSGSFHGRGDPSNYNEWAALLQNPSLNYTNMLKYFKMMENTPFSNTSYGGPNSQYGGSDSSDRGRSGPVQVSFTPVNDTNLNIPVSTFLSTFNTTFSVDYNTAAGLEGLHPMQRSIARSANCTPTSGPCARQSPYHTYILPNLANWPNLEVASGSQIVKIVTRVNDKGKTIAVGVDYYSGGTLIRARASEEVIVSAGAFGSPKLLMLSGIGPAEDLQALGIDVVMNLTGVGKNLQDHVFNIALYYAPGLPAVAVPSSVRMGFLKLANSTFINYEAGWGLLNVTDFNLPASAPGSLLLIEAIQLRNNGFGQVKLRSKNPFERLDIKFNFNPSNWAPQIEGIRKIRQWAAAIQTATGAPVQEFLPVGSGLALDANDAAISVWLSQKTNGFYHIAGTCKMGLSSDPTAVVDANYNVFGVNQLRVVDNSVQPILVASHPSVTSSALAERAAELILQDFHS